MARAGEAGTYLEAGPLAYRRGSVGRGRGIPVLLLLLESIAFWQGVIKNV